MPEETGTLSLALLLAYFTIDRAPTLRLDSVHRSIYDSVAETIGGSAVYIRHGMRVFALSLTR